jgi:hypothetical protein
MKNQRSLFELLNQESQKKNNRLETQALLDIKLKIHTNGDPYYPFIAANQRWPKLQLFFSGKQNTFMILPHYMKALLESTIGGLASQTWVGIASTNLYSRFV